MSDPTGPRGVIVKPGPFSFLPGAGEALGAIGQQKEAMRRQRQSEARQAATVLISMREQGFIGPEAFADPDVQQVFSEAGYGVSPSTQPTAGERLDALKKRYLSALGQPDQPATIPGAAVGGFNTKIGVPATTGFSPEQRAAVGAPQRSALIAERTAATAGAAQFPEARATALADTQTAQDKTYSQIADRIVEDLYTRNKKLPTAEEAFLVGKYDKRASVFGESLNQPYYGAAIERQRMKIEEEKTKRIAAASRAAGATPINIKLLGEVNKMVKQADDKLQDLQKPVNQILAGPKGAEVQQRLQEQRDALQQAATMVAAGIADETQIRELLRIAGQNLLNPIAGGATGLQPDQINKFAERALRQKDPEAALEAEVQAGRMTKEDKAAILKKMQEIAK